MTDMNVAIGVTADGKQASAELKRLVGDVSRLKVDLLEAAAATKAAAAAYKEHGKAAVVDAAEHARLPDALYAAKEAEVELTRQHAIAQNAMNASGRAAQNLAGNTGQARAAMTNLGQQLGDISTGLALGVAPATIFAQQAGQVAFAVQGLGGAARGVGAFLGGPWGIALTTAAVAFSPFLGKLFETEKAARVAKDGSMSFAREVGVIFDGIASKVGGAFDPLVTGFERAAKGVIARLPTFESVVSKTLRNIDALNGFGARVLGTAPTDYAGGYQRARGRAVARNRDEDFFDEVMKTIEDANAGQGDRERRQAIYDEVGRKAKEASDTAKRSAKELADETRRLADAYNPLLAAQLKYKESLDDIAKAERLGVLSAREAALIRRDALPELLSTQARGARLAGLGVTPSGPLQVASGGLAVRDSLADDIEKLGQKVGEQLKAASADIGNELAREIINDLAGAGQLIGGAIGQGISRSLQRAGGFADLLNRAVPGQGDVFIQAFAEAQQAAFRPLADIFKSAFKPDGEMAKTLGKVFGGAAAGGATADLANKLGIGLSRQGSEIGGAIGSAVGGLKGVTEALGKTLAGALPIIGGVLGGLVGGIFKGKNPFADVALTSSAAGVDPRLFNQRGEGSGAQGLSLAGAFGNQLTQLANALGGEIRAGLNLGAIGFSGEKFFFNPTGGDFKAAGNQRFNSAEEAVAAAVANALSTGAIATSPRVQAVLQRYATNVNQAVAEALKVKDLEQQLEAQGNPFAAAFRDFERQARQRVDIARQYGFDVIEIEKLNADQRAALVRDTLDRATGSARALLDEFRFGDRAGGSVRDRLTTLGGERDRLAGLVRGGDGGQLDALADVIRQIDDLQREAFGATGEAANGRAASAALLQELIDATEARVRTAAEAAQRAAAEQLGTLQSMDGTLEDIFQNGRQQLSALQAILAGMGGGGGGGFDFALASSVARG